MHMCVWGCGFPMDISLISFTLSSAIKIMFNVINSLLLVIGGPFTVSSPICDFMNGGKNVINLKVT